MLSKLFAIIFFSFLMFPAHAYALNKDEYLRIYQEKIRAMISKGILPIIDTEFHHAGGVEIENLFKAMDENGVALIWLAPVLKLGSEESLRMAELYPDRFVPTTMNGDSEKWHSGNNVFLKKLAQEARSGKYFAMGEFEARHYPSSTNTRDAHTKVDSEGMQTVFQLASETGIPFSLHHEAEDALLPELERMLAKYPKAKVIWCHVGRNRNYETWKKFRSANTVREFLSKYPNLYFDFIQSQPGSKYRYDGKGYGKDGYVEGIMYDYTSGKVTLDAEWKALIEDFPDRFVLGSDANTGIGMAKFDKYDKLTYIFRDIILKGLKPETAEKIAYKNAWRLMTGKDWSD